MENTEIMNEEIMEQTSEAVTENSGVNFGKIGLGVLVSGAVVALGYKCYKVVKQKKAQKDQEVYEDENFNSEDFEEE